MWLDIIAPLQCSDLSSASLSTYEVHVLIRLVEICQCVIAKQQCLGIPRNHMNYVLDSAFVGCVWHQTNQLTSLNGSLDCLKSFSSHLDPLWFLSGNNG